MRFETRGVLAGAYRGRRKTLALTRTHDVEIDENGHEIRVSCGRIPLDHLADRFAAFSDDELVAAPTCPRCLRAWTRRGSNAPLGCKESS